MLIDCARCPTRGDACPHCLVTALLDLPSQVAGLTADEHRAIEVFARAGFAVEVLPPPAPSRPAERSRPDRPAPDRPRPHRRRAGRGNRAA